MLRERDLALREGPVLSDGVRLKDLVDLENREISLRVFQDPEIYKLELQRLFARSWIAVGHVAELREAGSFVRRYVGEDPVIVTRDNEGGINVLLNVCPHRGMELCFADVGKTARFKCRNHGWVFDGKGHLLGAPFEREMFPGWDKSKYGLRALRVQVRYGVIWANGDTNCEPLDEYLGDLDWYLKSLYAGLEDAETWTYVTRPLVSANWKTITDQLSGDNYHVSILHHSAVELGFLPYDMMVRSADCVKVSMPDQGHALFLQSANSVNNYHFDGESRAGTILGFPATIGGDRSEYEENFGTFAYPSPDVKLFRGAYIGTIVPRGLRQFERWSIGLVDKAAPEKHKQAGREIGTRVMTSLFPVDDFEAFQSIQRATRGVLGQQTPMRFLAKQTPSKPEAFKGPGVVYAGKLASCKEESQWNYWLRWLDLMTREKD